MYAFVTASKIQAMASSATPSSGPRATNILAIWTSNNLKKSTALSEFPFFNQHHVCMICMSTAM